MKTKRITLTTVALTAAAVGVAFLGACTEENTPVSGPLPSRSSTFSGQRSDSVYPEERPFWALAQKYPSTAGFFRDPVTDDIVVSLTDMRDAAGVTTLLRSSLAEHLARARHRNPRADIVARQATYTFLQLEEWRDRIGWILMRPGTVSCSASTLELMCSPFAGSRGTSGFQRRQSTSRLMGRSCPVWR